MSQSPVYAGWWDLGIFELCEQAVLRGLYAVRQLLPWASWLTFQRHSFSSLQGPLVLTLFSAHQKRRTHFPYHFLQQRVGMNMYDKYQGLSQWHCVHLSFYAIITQPREPILTFSFCTWGSSWRAESVPEPECLWLSLALWPPRKLMMAGLSGPGNVADQATIGSIIFKGWLQSNNMNYMKLTILGQILTYYILIVA